jgi:hypothetical protein
MTATALPVDRADDQWGHEWAEWAEWARSGLLWLTGHGGHPPRWPVAGVLSGLDGVGRRLDRASGRLGHRCATDPRQLLAGRAALMGLVRRGRVSPGGACRLLATPAGWVAVSMARPDDAGLVPAVTWSEPGPDPWADLARAAATLRAGELADRAQLVGLPAGVLPTGLPIVVTGDPERVGRPEGAARGPSGHRPLVVDLSALWAGPLCAKLLGDAGARVVKVESRTRPDGARAGNPAFFDWLHAGHESVCLDFTSTPDREVLGALVDRADVVIEASRPRALASLGIDAGRLVEARPGKVWLSITGYGRQGESGGGVAFGDDAAVAAGLVAHDPAGGPVFCGDAAADPITGLQGARAVQESRARGGGELIELSMVDAVRSVMRPLPDTGAPPPPVRRGRSHVDAWTVTIGGTTVDVGIPSPFPPAPPAPALGADSGTVIAELASVV